MSDNVLGAKTKMYCQVNFDNLRYSERLKYM